MAQPACFITGPALQFGVAQMSFLTQLCIDHVLLADRKACSLGDLQQIFEVEGLLQLLLQLRLLAGTGEESIELFERHNKT